MRLYLCEKPSQGRDIARVLGANERRDGHLCNADVVVTWCIGHLVEAAPPDAYDQRYKRWSLTDLPILPVRWQFTIKQSTAAQFKILRKLLTRTTEVVLATDADREGEMIGREILDCCDYRGPIRRLWLSALDDASIRKALCELRAGHETLPLYHAALARSRADWLVGMNLSRLFTLRGRSAGYDGVLSVGRVQTPTLQIVVVRDQQIAAFVSSPYWVTSVTLASGGLSFRASWVAPPDAADERGRCIDQRVAAEIAAKLRSSSVAHVERSESQRIREAPPLPFDLSTLQQVCSRRLGIDVQETLNIAQRLYEKHHATTYPRTDCGYLPTTLFSDVPKILDALRASDATLEPVLKTLDLSQRSRAWNDDKITAHHGIVPTSEPTQLSAMSDRERNVYCLIRAHYLAQFLPHYEYDQTLAQLSCGEIALRARGRKVAVIGWRSLFADNSLDRDDDADDDHQLLPSLKRGASCDLAKVELNARKTSPPRPYTQGELVAAMKGVASSVNDPALKQILKDTAGIGTEATRAGIIEGLIGRGYLLKQGRVLRASPAAFTLIAAVPAAIRDPGTTALWEQKLDAIAAGQLTLADFVAQQSRWVAKLVQDNLHASLQLPPVRR